jgi:hypothetical protein
LQNGLIFMLAKYILAALAIAFLSAAVLRIAKNGGRLVPASKTWLIIAVIFGAVSLWLVVTTTA